MLALFINACQTSFHIPNLRIPHTGVSTHSIAMPAARARTRMISLASEHL